MSMGPPPPPRRDGRSESFRASRSASPVPFGNHTIYSNELPKPPRPIPEYFDQTDLYSNNTGTPHNIWHKISIHTARCDHCLNHNTSVIQRCGLCNRQVCKNCFRNLRPDDLHHTPNINALDWIPEKIQRRKRKDLARPRAQSGDSASSSGSGSGSPARPSSASASAPRPRPRPVQPRPFTRPSTGIASVDRGLFGFSQLDIFGRPFEEPVRGAGNRGRDADAVEESLMVDSDANADRDADGEFEYEYEDEDDDDDYGEFGPMSDDE